MAAPIRIQLRDVQLRALPVRSRVQLKRNDRLLVDVIVAAGQEGITVSGIEGPGVCSVAVFSAGPFADTAMFLPLSDSTKPNDVVCLVKSKHATPALPSYADLPKDLTSMLENSLELDLDRKAREISDRTIDARTLETRRVGEDRELTERSEPPVPAGERRWNALDDRSKAGLLNLFAKMRSVTVSSERRTVWSYLEQLRAIAPDRIKGRVKPELIAATDESAAFLKPLDVPFFHKPDRGFSRAGTWKTREKFGNLQLTFSVATEDRTVVHMDADVDDAAGSQHAEQVLRNESRGLFKKIFGFLIPGLPDGISHPYDIHQIVVQHQRRRDDTAPGIGDYEPCYRLKVDGVPPPYDV